MILFFIKQVALIMQSLNFIVTFHDERIVIHSKAWLDCGR